MEKGTNHIWAWLHGIDWFDFTVFKRFWTEMGSEISEDIECTDMLRKMRRILGVESLNRSINVQDIGFASG